MKGESSADIRRVLPVRIPRALEMEGSEGSRLLVFGISWVRRRAFEDCPFEDCPLVIPAFKLDAPS